MPGRKKNVWMAHVAAVWKVQKPKGMSYRDVLKHAKLSYKKSPARADAAKTAVPKRRRKKKNEKIPTD